MRTEILGDGEPEIALICCIHGDEQCGRKAFQRFKEEQTDLKSAVKLIYANEKAMEKDEWFIKKDLNRCFPGDSESDVYEERVAAEITEEVKGMKVLDFHSSYEDETKFAITTTSTDEAYRLASSTGMKKAVDFSKVKGAVIPDCTRIAVECGITGTENAVETALWILKNFLKAEGLLEGQAEVSTPEYFRIYESEEGTDYKFVRENFQKVKKGETYAFKDEDKKKAEKDFIPILMSDDGYDDMIGFKAQKFNPL